ncbi:MAG: hypothetical protein EA350_11080 [Gemmatimonadales bacterium]|nr:MAG: hypothetical protein EA350_11080 [Gemmatimonadales bacterium]
MRFSPHSLRALARSVAVCAGLAVLGVQPALAQQRINLPPALRATLQTSADPTARIQVTDPDGRVITDAARPSVRGEAIQLASPELRTFIVRLDEVEQMRLPAQVERVALPGGLVMPTPGDERPAWFQLTLAASPTPAVWDAALGRYVTRLWFGLRASDHADPGLVPDRPVSVRLGYVGLAAEDVEVVPLERPGLEHEREVELHFLPTTATPTLQVRSTLTSVDFALEAPARVELRPTRLDMPGFGLGTIGFAVTHVLPHGVAAPATSDMPISLMIEGGAILEPESVVIREGEMEARFSLRSSGLGEVRVSAGSAGSSASATIRQTLPLGPWLAALLGGLLGAFARGFLPQSSESPKPHGHGGRGTSRRLVEGVVVAAIAYVAAVLGVAFLGVPAAVAATEAGAFLTGALAGFAGVVLLEKLSPLSRGTEAGEPA